MKEKYYINLNFFKTWSPQMAWVLGIITSDGCIYSKQYQLILKMKDKDILEKIKIALQSNHPIKHIYYYSKWKKKCDIYSLVISRKVIVNDLIKLGLTPHKSKTVIFPIIPKKYHSHFIRGIFDGDGTIEKYGKKEKKYRTPIFITASQKFAYKLKEIFDTLNFPTKIYWTCYNTFRIRTSTKVWNWMYKEKNIFFGERKFSQVAHYINRLHRYYLV